MRKTVHQFIPSKSNVLWAIFTSICPALFCCQFIAFACNAKSFAISIFFSFILLYSKFGRTGKSCLSSFSGLLSYTSVAQFGHCGKTLCDKYLFQSEISYAKAMCLHTMRYAKHTMCFRESNNGGSKLLYKSGHVNTITFFIM